MNKLIIVNATNHPTVYNLDTVATMELKGTDIVFNHTGNFSSSFTCENEEDALNEFQKIYNIWKS